MRVLLVHNFYQITGGEDSVVRAERSMMELHGVEVDLFSVSNDTIKGRARQAMAAVQAIYNPLARRALARRLAQRPPDIVHVHNFFPLLSPAVFDACHDAGIPSVMTLHNFRILCPTALLGADNADRERSLRQSCWWTVPKKVYRNSASATLALASMVELHKRLGTWRRKVDHFVTLTEWAKQVFVQGGLPAERISVKPNCVSTPSDLGPQPRTGALFVGRLDEQKGIRVLLEAWRTLDCPLKIIGDGPLSDIVRQAANPHITCLGRQPPEIVQREMQAAQILVLPSIGYEMFPLTILEAYASRLPVICSDLPSLRNLVEEGVTGVTFPPGDPAALAARVRQALSDAPMLERLGRQARLIYDERYTPEANVSQLLAIYRSVCRLSRNHA